jgi:hypothetical protein
MSQPPAVAGRRLKRHGCDPTSGRTHAVSFPVLAASGLPVSL